MTARYLLSMFMLVAIAGCQSTLNDNLPVAPERSKQAPHTTDLLEMITYMNTLPDTKGCFACHDASNKMPNPHGSLDSLVLLVNALPNTSACFKCHNPIPSPHPAGYIVPASNDFHGTLLRGSGDNLTPCASCHGSDLDGGWSNKSCNASGCHVKADGGPKACYTCHGDPVTKDIYPKIPAFHTTHIKGGAGSAVLLNCGACHNYPSSFDDPNHIGGTNVVLKSPLGATVTKGSVGNMTWTPSTQTCSNVYCHGNFTNGNNASVTYAGQDQAKCGSCHGDPATGNPLPKAPHPAVATCSACHTGVIDANGAIIDKSKHINGKLNVFNNERTDW